MKTIPLTQGKVALVDDEDFERLSMHKWTAERRNGKVRIFWYAIRKEPVGYVENRTKYKTKYLHQEILGVSTGIDHKDGDGLNNQRHNLRLCSQTQNSQNKLKRKGCSSKYKGVCWFRPAKLWAAGITVNGRSISLKYFKSEIDAAKVYDAAAVKYFGEFAKTNKSLGLL